MFEWDKADMEGSSCWWPAGTAGGEGETGQERGIEKGEQMQGKYLRTIYNNVESPQSRQASHNSVGTRFLVR